MTFIAQLCAFGSILYIIKVCLYPFFKPASRKQKKRARQYLQDRKTNLFNEKLAYFKRKFAFLVVRKLMSPTDRNRYQKMLRRLDMDKLPEEVRLEQIFYATVALLISLIMHAANPMLGFISAAFIVLGWLYPVSELEKTIERKNKNIGLDFPAFYSMVYYQYSKSYNIFLADVIKDFLPNANPDMAEELGVMLDNIEYGEKYALDQFKKRVPLHYVIKFCDIMETRIKGYDNTSQMAYLKNELDNFRIRALEDELERRERTNARLQMVLIVVLAVYIIIYYLFTILDAMRMFQ